MSKRTMAVAKHHKFMKEYWDKKHEADRVVRQLLDKRFADQNKKEEALHDIEHQLVTVAEKYADGKFRTAREMANGTGFTAQELGCNLNTGCNCPLGNWQRVLYRSHH